MKAGTVDITFLQVYVLLSFVLILYRSPCLEIFMTDVFNLISSLRFTDNVVINSPNPLGKLNELGFQTNLFEMSSPWVGMNILSIDPETVLVDKRQVNFIKFLESKKIKVVPVSMRHIYTQGGGIHCATLDTVRESKFENYFD